MSVGPAVSEVNLGPGNLSCMGTLFLLLWDFVQVSSLFGSWGLHFLICRMERISN
jgi:hypothetical protein